jgi:uncharacterized protein YeaO (DUF488 family)
LVQGQGGFEFSAAGILVYFEDWKRGPDAEMGSKDNLETAPRLKSYFCYRQQGDKEMTIRIVRLGTERGEGEGLRIGTVRRPPRGVPKSEYASQNWYDVWLPNLAPSAELMKLGRAAASEKDWAGFVRKYRAEMADPEKSRIFDLLSALSHQTDFSVGCYCENEERCHRSVLRELLTNRGAKVE